MSRTQCVFVATDKVGKEDLGLGNEEPYDAVTCMFAIHYFFATEQTLHCFLRNASAALADRGFFFGTCPDGKAVMAGVQKGGGQSLHLPMLRLTRMWEGKEPQPFGSKYTCHIADTGEASRRMRHNLLGDLGAASAPVAGSCTSHSCRSGGGPRGHHGGVGGVSGVLLGHAERGAAVRLVPGGAALGQGAGRRAGQGRAAGEGQETNGARGVLAVIMGGCGRCD